MRNVKFKGFYLNDIYLIFLMRNYYHFIYFICIFLQIIASFLLRIKSNLFECSDHDPLVSEVQSPVASHTAYPALSYFSFSCEP